MNNLLRFSLLVLSYFSINTSSAQSYVVEFESEKSATEFLSQSRNAVLDIKRIGQSTAIYNIYANALKEDELAEMLKDPSILQYAKNHKVYTRDIPDDDDFGRQWPLPLIQADKAWDLVEQGLTIDNREIVIAFLDNSCQISHPDLINNIWTNDAEIPNDGIDNDGNGYVDDYYGLHVDSRNDDHPHGVHGTKVAGIIGAEGNNSMGIAGINWKIKMMVITGADNSADIIEGYNYVLDQRRLYNQTNGAEGAFVVAVNLSAGIPYAFGENYPLWCGMYDKLGAEGIVSVTATDNANYDVDIEGDMPTTCQSEFMISTTSTNRLDSKSALSAYGLENIDLGAPGEDTYSTSDGDGYNEFTGTSAAAPHVAGAIGLLYAANCQTLIDNAILDPIAASRMVKEAILSSVKPISSLSSRSVSGGRLDMFNAMSALSDLCNDGMLSSREQLKFTSIGPNPVKDQITFQYDFAKFKDHEIKVFNTIGQLVYKKTITPSLFTKPMAIIDLELLTQGMYLLYLSDGENKLTWKFLKD